MLEHIHNNSMYTLTLPYEDINTEDTNDYVDEIRMLVADNTEFLDHEEQEKKILEKLVEYEPHVW